MCPIMFGYNATVRFVPSVDRIELISHTSANFQQLVLVPILEQLVDKRIKPVRKFCLLDLECL